MDFLGVQMGRCMGGSAPLPRSDLYLPFHPSAGEPELACAATVLECVIHVYQQSTQGGLGMISQYGELAKGGSRPPAINLLFHRLGHYDLLILMPGQIQSKL